MDSTRRLARAGAAAALLLGASEIDAGYPERPVRLIVPFVPGGSTDVLARVLGQKLGDKLGQPFLIDNRAGAGGTIGTAIAVKSNRDGYTLVSVPRVRWRSTQACTRSSPMTSRATSRRSCCSPRARSC